MTIALPPTFYIIAERETGRNAAGSAAMVRESGLLCSKADVAEFLEQTDVDPHDIAIIELAEGGRWCDVTDDMLRAIAADRAVAAAAWNEAPRGLRDWWPRETELQFGYQGVAR